MKRTIKHLLGAAALLSAAVLRSGAAPSSNELMRRALKDESRTYAGELAYTQWGDGRVRAEEARIYVAAPGIYRFEYLSPAGAVQRVILGRGADEIVFFPRQGKAWRGPARRPPAADKSDRAFARLSKNYRVSTPVDDDIAGRPAWAITLTPVDAGKPHQTLWFDQATGVLLASRRFLPGTPYAASVRFVRFDPDVDFEDGFFEMDSGAVKRTDDHGWAGRPGPTDPPPPAKAELPFGFALENRGQFEVQGETVTHLSYSDGLAVVSVFETRHPVRVPSGAETPPPNAGPRLLNVSIPARVVHGRRDGVYLTVIGDDTAELLHELWRRFP